MNFFVVYLSHKRFVVVKREWIQTPELRSSSLFFYSKNQNAQADFTTDPLYYINEGLNACYKGFIIQGFGKHDLFYFSIYFQLFVTAKHLKTYSSPWIDCYEDAEKYASKKRLVAPVKFNQNDEAEKFEEIVDSNIPVDCITINVSDDDTAAPQQQNVHH